MDKADCVVLGLMIVQAQPAADFLFASHGNPHYLGLYDIGSPGLTASLAIVNHVSTLI
jgi:hypothetical protein